MPDTSNPGPRFKVGDHVETLGPGNVNRGKRGVVVEVIGPAGDLVYRYHVRFLDGTSAVFFGFELQSADGG
jgi:hypothetical protein